MECYTGLPGLRTAGILSACLAQPNFPYCYIPRLIFRSGQIMCLDASFNSLLIAVVPTL